MRAAPVTPIRAAAVTPVAPPASDAPRSWNDLARSATTSLPGSEYSGRVAEGLTQARKGLGGFRGNFRLPMTTADTVLQAAEHVPLAQVQFDTANSPQTESVYAPKQASSTFALANMNAGPAATQLYASLEQAIEVASALPKVANAPGGHQRIPAVGIVELQHGVFALEGLSLLRPADKKSGFSTIIHTPRWTHLIDPDPPSLVADNGAQLGAALTVTRADKALRAIVGRRLAEEPSVILDFDKAETWTSRPGQGWLPA